MMILEQNVPCPKTKAFALGILTGRKPPVPIIGGLFDTHDFNAVDPMFEEAALRNDACRIPFSSWTHRFAVRRGN